MFGFCEAREMFGYTSRTVSYAEELASVSICYSRRGGFNTPLSRLLHCTMHAESVLFCVQMTLSRVIDKMVVDEGRALQP